MASPAKRMYPDEAKRAQTVDLAADPSNEEVLHRLDSLFKNLMSGIKTPLGMSLFRRFSKTTTVDPKIEATSRAKLLENNPDLKKEFKACFEEDRTYKCKDNRVSVADNGVYPLFRPIEGLTVRDYVCLNLIWIMTRFSQVLPKKTLELTIGNFLKVIHNATENFAIFSPNYQSFLEYFFKRLEPFQSNESVVDLITQLKMLGGVIKEKASYVLGFEEGSFLLGLNSVRGKEHCCHQFLRDALSLCQLLLNQATLATKKEKELLKGLPFESLDETVSQEKLNVLVEQLSHLEYQSGAYLEDSKNPYIQYQYLRQCQSLFTNLIIYLGPMTGNAKQICIYFPNDKHNDYKKCVLSLCSIAKMYLANMLKYLPTDFAGDPYYFQPLELAQPELCYPDCLPVSQYAVKLRGEVEGAHKLRSNLSKGLSRLFLKAQSLVVESMSSLERPTIMDQIVGLSFERLALSVSAFQRALYQHSSLVLRASLIHLLKNSVIALEHAMAAEAHQVALDQGVEFKFAPVRGLMAQHRFYVQTYGTDEECGIDPMDMPMMAICMQLDTIVCSDRVNLHTVLSAIKKRNGSAHILTHILAGGHEAVKYTQGLVSKCFEFTCELMEFDAYPSFSGKWPNIDMLEIGEDRYSEPLSKKSAAKLASSVSKSEGAGAAAAVATAVPMRADPKPLTAKLESLLFHLDMILSNSFMDKTSGKTLIQDTVDHLKGVDIMIKSILKPEFDFLDFPLYVETILESLRAVDVNISEIYTLYKVNHQSFVARSTKDRFINSDRSISDASARELINTHLHGSVWEMSGHLFRVNNTDPHYLLLPRQAKYMALYAHQIKAGLEVRSQGVKVSSTTKMEIWRSLMALYQAVNKEMVPVLKEIGQHIE
ncbi:MAG: hypothetical protein P0S95_07120 [Rhabdochlamydiaceae bacterium]|nr:hypothetical protein [Candidatus Amphrikana amoebophyrae]